MHPILTACIVAFAIFISYLLGRAIGALVVKHSLKGDAAKEFKLLIDSIKLSDTFSEYEFWRQEATSFMRRYQPGVNPRIMLAYRILLNTALNERQQRGFIKEFITDKL